MAVDVGGMSIAWPAFFIGMRSEEKLPVAGFLYDIKVLHGYQRSVILVLGGAHEIINTKKKTTTDRRI